MARPRLIIPGHLYENCLRTEDGLPFVPTPYMEAIIRGVMVEALTRYSVRLIDFLIMGNHVHLLFIVWDAKALSDFMCYFKREVAHAVNNLLGRKRHTVWESGFKPMLIADLDTAIKRMVYFYTNPARAGLVDSIEHYPGMSTWSGVLNDGFVLKGRKIPREAITTLPKGEIQIADQNKLAARLIERGKEERTIQIDPLAFVELFPESKYTNRNAVKEKIIKDVRKEEADYRAMRTLPVIGRMALQLQNFRKPYTPSKYSPAEWVLGATKEIRLPILKKLNELWSERDKLKSLLSPMEFIQQLPPGFFAPGGFLRANLNPYLLTG